MRIRKKVLAFALFSTGMAVLLIRSGAPLQGLSLLMISLSLHIIHIIMYVKKIQ